jgi:phage terminase small subunit
MNNMASQPIPAVRPDPKGNGRSIPPRRRVRLLDRPRARCRREFDPQGLTLNQEQFVFSYLKTGNGKQAAIEAGYSPRTATVQASKMLRVPKIWNEVERLRRRLRKRWEITADRVLEELAYIAFSDPRELFNSDGSIKNPVKLSRETVAMLRSWRTDQRGNPTICMADRLRALELLGKSKLLNLFGPDEGLPAASALTIEQLDAILRGELVIPQTVSHPLLPPQ